jgi:hypothetical protein
LCLFGYKESLATHILGGNISYEFIEGNRYFVQLTLYFDDINGNPGANDPTTTIDIYNLESKSRVRTLLLSKIDSTTKNLNYNCIGFPNQSILYSYGAEVELNFLASDKLILYWDRCCRTDNMSNIDDSEASGMGFYCELTTQINNSSPDFGVKSPDVAFVDEIFLADASGIDKDGDSLIYSLVTPFEGFSTQNDPLPELPNNLGEIPRVSFSTGFSVDNMFGSLNNEVLTIDANTGLLRGLPRQTGSFLVGIKTNEFRNGVKIASYYNQFTISCNQGVPQTKILSGTVFANGEPLDFGKT